MQFLWDLGHHLHWGTLHDIDSSAFFDSKMPPPEYSYGAVWIIGPRHLFQWSVGDFLSYWCEWCSSPVSNFLIFMDYLTCKNACLVQGMSCLYRYLVCEPTPGHLHLVVIVNDDGNALNMCSSIRISTWLPSTSLQSLLLEIILE